ncbi:MAG TPA: energy transducer TonB [Pyrinomonadaceae bacterium]|jgi:hypothetical protein|nr:energy transducer TonB [Pyrinomonadaceae bacterium]
MSKALKRLALAALAVSLCAPTLAGRVSRAQSPARPVPGWVSVSPGGEGFVARMPKAPAPLAREVKAGGLSVSGVRYAAEGEGGTAFVVWSLKDSGEAGRRLSADNYKGWHLRPEADSYLDQAAELAWELLVRPEVERPAKESTEDAEKARASMAWRFEFDTGDGRPARAYFLTLGGKRGPVYVCVDGPQIYVVTALAAADAQFPQLDFFAESFGLKKGGDANLPSPSFLRDDTARHFYINGLPTIGRVTSAAAVEEARVGELGGIRFAVVGRRGGDYAVEEPDAAALKKQPAEDAGGVAPVDYGRPFRRSEVTREAQITHNPEPGSTDEARKFGVAGTVFLRAVLAATGEVRDIAVVSRLPHGLTEKAIAAAKQVRFNPAEKDGRKVSQYAILEYDFNGY